MHSCGNCRISQCRSSFASTDYQCSDSEDTLDCQVDSVVLQCSSVRKNQDNLGILQKDYSQNVMYRTLLSYYSRTSHNGPSEKRTEHYNRLEIPTLMLILAILTGVALSCESHYTKLVIIYSMNRANGMS